MISEKDYYTVLYQKLIAANQEMFSKCDEKKLCNVDNKDYYFDRLYDLLDQVEEKYEFDMQKMLMPNYKKFVLWQEYYLEKIDLERIRVATEFIVLCCLVDKILDSKRFTNNEKDLVCEKIVIDNFISSSEFNSSGFVEIDMLLNSIRKYLLKTECNEFEKEKLLSSMDKAFVSEIYMYRYPLGQYDFIKKRDYHYLTDKSIEFEKAAFMIATYANNTDMSVLAATNVGNIFCLIDDLCDLFDDIKYRRRNSILFTGLDFEEPIDTMSRIEFTYDNMDVFIEKILNNLNELKVNVSAEFYCYILNEIWEWCSGVRRMFQ